MHEDKIKQNATLNDIAEKMFNLEEETTEDDRRQEDEEKESEHLNSMYESSLEGYGRE